MARVHGRMPGKTCKWGCCPIGELEEKRMMREELDLAAEELGIFPNEPEDDPNWDGALDYDEDDLKGVKHVTFIPAPPDDAG